MKVIRIILLIALGLTSLLNYAVCYASWVGLLFFLNLPSSPLIPSYAIPFPYLLIIALISSTIISITSIPAFIYNIKRIKYTNKSDLEDDVLDIKTKNNIEKPIHGLLFLSSKLFGLFLTIMIVSRLLETYSHSEYISTPVLIKTLSFSIPFLTLGIFLLVDKKANGT